MAAWSDEDVHGHEARKVAKSLLEVCVLFSYDRLCCAIERKSRYVLRYMARCSARGAYLYCCIWYKFMAALQGLRLGLCTARKTLRISSMLQMRVWVCVFWRPADLCCECGLRYTPCRLARRVQRTCGFGVHMSNCWRSSAVELRRLRWQRRPYRCCR